MPTIFKKKLNEMKTTTDIRGLRNRYKYILRQLRVDTSRGLMVGLKADYASKDIIRALRYKGLEFESQVTENCTLFTYCTTKQMECTLHQNKYLLKF